MPDTDAYAAMTDIEFMTIYRHSYYHVGALRARLDQAALGTGYAPRRSAPSSESAKIAAERTRRGLEFPADWVLAGLRDEREDF
jgi:hypothetical protein